MVTCHSLTVIDGEISGDPLDLIMFKSTKWVSNKAKAMAMNFILVQQFFHVKLVVLLKI